ncbi:MAG TPA: STAS domain-containing protein [Bryobacteraceae bacterium]|jgi:rsbT co-antagonist protein RsbR|nr:STAS domain-containing protein [Bryobacteraceae bacterium]
MASTLLPEIIARHENELLAEWLRLQNATLTSRRDRTSETQLRANAKDFLRGLSTALSKGAGTDVETPAWSEVRQLLTDFSRERVAQGFTPSETATFVLSFKQPLFAEIGTEFAMDPKSLQAELWLLTETLDKLGLYTFESFLKSRESVILRQQQEMMELSTPVVELWTGVLALPVIGTLDSQRTQIVMQSLLEAIVEKSADLAIIDITGVPTVDTLVAQHLLKTVAAARLMGADCIISGIRPQIAQTIIHLGVDLAGVLTKATLADAFKLALQKKKLTVTTIQKS